MPNWTNLFTAPADCECDDCGNIFSPAAYLVDIMQYLDNCAKTGAYSPLDILLGCPRFSGDTRTLPGRRPDIGNLLLTCSNTNTEIPYIDLVNEIMEYYVANYQGQLPLPTFPPGANLSNDTGDATQAELSAEPQYTLIDAYSTIYTKGIYPFNLPYHQPLDMIRGYLGFLSTSRAELMKVFPFYFNQTTSAFAAIPANATDAESMLLSLKEYEILTNVDFFGTAIPAVSPEVYFGNPPPAYIGSATGIPVNDLLLATGLQYPDLLAIIETKFINPGQDAFNVLQDLLAQSGIPAQTLYNELTGNTWQGDAAFEGVLIKNNIQAAFAPWLAANLPLFQAVITFYVSSATCDVTQTFLHSVQWLYEPPGPDNNIDTDFLSKLHRFIRLWNKTGWAVQELDNMITALGAADITADLIHQLATVTQVNAVLNLPLLQLACLWGNIDTYGDDSLYAQLFLSNSNIVNGNGVTEASIFTPDPLDYILTQNGLLLSAHLPEIFAALGISADDYSSIVADANIDPVNGTITVTALSVIYRYQLLATTLGISVADLCTLKTTCFGVNPFTSPDTALTFIREFQKFQNVESAGFSVGVLAYVLTGNAKAVDDIGLTQTQVLAGIPVLSNAVGASKAPAPLIAAYVSSLTGLDIPNVNALLAGDVGALTTALTDPGLTGSYYADPAFTTLGTTETDGAITFNWGANAPNTHVPANGFSIRWTGWICPPANDNYTFSINILQLDDTAALWVNGALVLSLNRPDLPGTLNATTGQGVCTLTGGTLYSIKIEYTHNAGNAGIQLSWQTATMPVAVVASNYLFPDSDIQLLLSKLMLYERAALVIQGFSLSAPETAYFIANPADFGNTNFLPVSIAQWLRLYDYTTLRKIIPANLLLGIFQQAAAEDQASPGQLPSDNLVSAIAAASVTGWNKDFLSFLAGNLNTVPAPTISFFSFTAASFRNEVALLQIQKAIDLAIKTQMPVSRSGLPSWTSIETNAADPVAGGFNQLHLIAGQIKNAVKGKFNSDWLNIAPQLNNVIRENQKQALISYLLTLNLVLPTPGAGTTVTNADLLYEYLLIDVQTTSLVSTSRLIQATLAVQLFADRCLLGLETGVAVSAITPSEWEWMRHYSVAAGLKELFVFVENYLDPSLRDDKTPFFLDFESAIKQGDITADNVENAFRDYLYSLNEVSNLEVCGMYNDTATLTLHVFGRTHNAPYTYYYRTATGSATMEDAYTWTAWEEVDLDIKSIDNAENSGVHLMPIAWKKRIFLFWPEFTSKTASSANSNGSQTFVDISKGPTNDPANQSQTYWSVRLAWSEYASDRWIPKKLSDQVLTPFNTSAYPGSLPQLAVATPDQFFLRLTFDTKQALLVSLYVNPGTLETGPDLTDFNDTPGRPCFPLGCFKLTDIHEKIVVTDVPGAWVNREYINEEIDDLYIADADLFKPNPAYYTPFYQSLNETNSLSIEGTDFLGNSIDHNVLFSRDIQMYEHGMLDFPFFYSDLDNNKSCFVTPVRTVRHIEINPIIPVPIQVPVTILKDRPNAPLSIVNLSGLMKKPVVTPVRGRFAAVTPAAAAPAASAAPAAVAPAFISARPPAINNFSNPGFQLGKTAGAGMLDVSSYPYVFAGDPNPVIGWLLANRGLAFYTFYHPFTAILIKLLNEQGVAAFLQANTAEFKEDPNYPYIDTDPDLLANDAGVNFTLLYGPYYNVVQQYDPTDPKRNYYLRNVDFSDYGTYSIYNWELFFHAPFLIATTLSNNGKYAEARSWFHYIFNPQSTEPADPGNPNSPFWEVLPFKKAMTDDIISCIEKLPTGYNDNTQIDNWRKDPFNAFLIARGRPLAFMKNVVMAYLDNLINWGDDLFRTYTRENINEATLLYVLAAQILGPAPQYIPTRGTTQGQSFNSISSQLNDLGDALVSLENAFPNSSPVQQTSNSVPQNLLGIGQTLYFCIPPNSQLLQYWATVSLRLFQIRRGQNIDGVFTPLPLYEPPIDPALLLQAHAQGLDIAGILAEIDNPPPIYRYSYLLQKASAFTDEVVALGGALLSANEKQDAEQLSRLRQTQETDLLTMVMQVKTRQVLEAQSALDNLYSSRTTAQQKFDYYSQSLLGVVNAPVPVVPPLLDTDLDENSTLPDETIIPAVSVPINTTPTATSDSGVKVIPEESLNMTLNEAAQYVQLAGNALDSLAGVLHIIPDFGISGAFWGLGTTSTVAGGKKLADSISAAGRAVLGAGSFLSAQAASAGQLSSFIRREQEWQFQANIAAREIVGIDRQITAANIRLQIAQAELANHRQQIQNSQTIEQFLLTKFSKQELYDWMNNQLQAAHKQAYQLAFDMARCAESAYRFELGIPDSSFVQYGYYNDTYLGITAGEQLQVALKQMDAAYTQNNMREFELTKHVSILQLCPIALIQLKQSGSCTINLPENLFDMDYPGHYFRRIKSVSMTIPCVAGPYTTVNSTLRLTKNQIRTTASTNATLTTNTIPVMAIATSAALNDSGMFEFNFRDERYLPFEGAGAISSWTLELNGKYIVNDAVTDLSQFDYDTISDVLIHIKYTSREDTGAFRQSVIQSLANIKGPFWRLFSIRHEFPNAWYAFLNQPAANGDQTYSLQIDTGKLPYFVAKANPVITDIALYADAAQFPVLQVTSPAGMVDNNFAFAPAPQAFGALLVSDPAGQNWGNNTLGLWKIVKPGNPLIAAGTVNDIYVLVKYSIN